MPEIQVSPIAGYVRDPSALFPSASLHTTAPIHEELFACLDYFAEVEQSGIELMVQRGQSEEHAKKYFPLFRAFIRQGRTFYLAAMSSHHRASPLLFYYSFLNLAKALICTFDGSKVAVNKIQHGLTDLSIEGDLKAQRVRTSPGVFPMLYEVVCETPIANATELSIADLFGYAMDVGSEIQQTNFAQPKWARLIVTMCRTGNKSFPIVMVNGYSVLNSCQWAIDQVSSELKVVEIAPATAHRYFECEFMAAVHSTCFEGKEKYEETKPTGISLAEARAGVRHAFQGLALPSIRVNKNEDCTIYAPYGPDCIRMNELIACYAIIFQMGSMVRYRPHVIESVLLQSHAWLFERFVRSVPISLLKHLVNKFTPVASRFSTS